MNNECRAFLYDALARAPLYISVLFLGTVFLQYANLEAGCTKNGYDIAEGQTHEEASLASVDCTGKAYGLAPSSILTTLNTVAGLLVACMLPVIGSIVDHTTYRKECVMYGMYVFWLSNFAQIFTFQATWFLSVLVQGFVSAQSYMVHQTALFAYCPEVVEDMDRDIAALNASGRVWEVSTMFAFMLAVTIISAVAGVEEIGKARISQVLACLLAVYPVYVVGKGLKGRPALHAVPEGSSVITEGFRKLNTTYNKLQTSNVQVIKFLTALLFFESANSNIINASTTFITQQLKIEDPSMMLLYILVVTIPGAAIGPHLKEKFGIKQALMFCITLNLIATLSHITIINSPSRAGGIWISGTLYGVGIGMTYPLQRGLFMLMIPSGQETEMIGLYQFTGAILSWAPSLAFTILNEHIGDLRIAMVSILIFQVLGLLLLLRVNVAAGREDAIKTEHLRYKEGGGSDSRTEAEEVEMVGSLVEQKDSATDSATDNVI
jgi:MFS-type transporter involved in bile tolerance (Atg22 family)